MLITRCGNEIECFKKKSAWVPLVHVNSTMYLVKQWLIRNSIKTTKFTKCVQGVPGDILLFLSVGEIKRCALCGYSLESLLSSAIRIVKFRMYEGTRCSIKLSSDNIP